MIGAGLVSGAAAPGLDATPGVFVPAVMGAGLVFSLATVAHDLFSLSSRDAAIRRARLRGELLAAEIRGVDGEREVVGLVGRPVLAVVGITTLAFAAYVGIGTTANFLRSDGYVSDIAWLWGGSLVVAAAATFVGVACLAAATRHRVPPWTWATLFGSPLVGHARPDDHRSVDRWLMVVGATVLTLLTILATWPHVLEPLDRRLADLVDEDRWLARLETPGRLAGSTQATVVVAAIIGVATLRCRRFAWVFIWSVAISLAATNVLRVVVDRPRPEWGQLAGATDSFPSGHLVQATLLALLLPLAVHQLTRSTRWRRVASVALLLAVAVVAIVAMSTGRHHPTDLLAGAALAIVVGGWARATIRTPSAHRECARCVFGDQGGTA